ncbi:MAG TPA: type IX secretion system membrane protein PorP/SprF [Saprospiraceae bacterium]|nr:type IX secretion system membrane protein PorP/SprF [Saprospiraceae bacterium]HMQ83096.1 type IX secretion system membrane protein PorP/SprF [Saprospiraceae bacterium]
MNKISTCLLLCIGFCSNLSGQQAAQYSLFMANKMNWNPAYAGMDQDLSITGIYRTQWQGLEGNPITQNVNVHLPVYAFNSGFGLNLENDQLGAEKATSFALAYNYQLPVGKKSLLALGLSAGIFQYSLDGSKLRTPQGFYSDATVIFHDDDLLPVSLLSASTPTFGAGVYFYNEKFESGFGVRHLTAPSVSSDNLSIALDRTFFFNLNGHFDLSRSFTFHPALLLRSNLKQMQTDVAALFKYNDNILGGASLRGYNSNSLDAVGIIFGVKLSEQVNVLYAYDITLSGLRQVSNGSHEIMLNYRIKTNFGQARLPKIIYNPRTL